MTSLRWTAPFLLIALAPLAGCGGGSETLSEQELIAKGDAACQQGQKRFAEIGQLRPQSAEQAGEVTAKLIASAKVELGKLKALEPPAELEEKFNAYLAAKEEALEILEKRKAAADRADEGAYGRLGNRLAKGQPQRLKLAQAVGFKHCSRTVTPEAAEGGQ